MIVLMGGSGSTGSSLLKNILNRHSMIFAGEESNLFCKRELYHHFDKAKHKIPHRKWKGLKNFGWHIYNGIDLHTPEYSIDAQFLQNTIDTSSTFSVFCEKLFHHFSRHHHQQIWIEKTPANSANFEDFLSNFPEGKVIHITRNPLDTIASLVNRGYSLYYAVGIYLLNTANGIKHFNQSRCFHVKYEELIEQPHKTVSSICEYLNITYDSNMLVPQHEKLTKTQLEGWKYDETAKIGKESVGRYSRLSEQVKREIDTAIHSIFINKTGQNYYNLEIKTVEEIAAKLSYPLTLNPNTKSTKSLKIERCQDRMRRLFKLYPTGINYPLSIH